MPCAGKIFILDEGNQPYPRFTKCDMFVSHKSLNGRHLVKFFFQRGEERKRCRLAEEKERAGTELAITVYEILLALATFFKYLQRVLLAADVNWPLVVINIWQSSQKWVRLTRVLIIEGADARTSGHIYLLVVQLVLLYRSETLVLQPCIKRVLGGFHHMVAHRMTGQQPWKGRNGG